MTDFCPMTDLRPLLPTLVYKLIFLLPLVILYSNNKK